jgi:membrane protein
MRAMSLVYTTLLSLVPLLAVSFSVLKAFGVQNQLEPALLNFLAPLGPKGAELTATIIGFVDNMRVGVLGSVGLALLLYTVVSLIQKVERAFNYTWHVSHNRRFVERFSDYLSVLLIGPVLMFSALGATASILNTSLVLSMAKIPVLGWIIDTGGTLLPYFFAIAAFTFVYVFVPNTRVRLGPAVVGAIVAGVLWQSIGWGFAFFMVGSTNYAAIYSGFAILILRL